MEAVATKSAEEDVRSFIEEYFASWTSTDEQAILAYYSEDIVLRVPWGTLRQQANRFSFRAAHFTSMTSQPD